jgi:hypothetical protein
LNLEPVDLGIQNNLYIGEAPDAVDEVTRHARVETCTANQKANLGDLACKIDDSLARGVAGPDQGDLLVRAEFRFDWRYPKSVPGGVLVDYRVVSCITIAIKLLRVR